MSWFSAAAQHWPETCRHTRVESWGEVEHLPGRFGARAAPQPGSGVVNNSSSLLYLHIGGPSLALRVMSSRSDTLGFLPGLPQNGNKSVFVRLALFRLLPDEVEQLHRRQLIRKHFSFFATHCENNVIDLAANFHPTDPLWQARAPLEICHLVGNSFA